MKCGRDIRESLEEMHRNPLAAYSTQQLKEELHRRWWDHAGLRLKVKLQLLRRRRRMFYRR